MTGGLSIGCPENSGAAGTYFNAHLLSLKVSNDNVTHGKECNHFIQFNTSFGVLTFSFNISFNTFNFENKSRPSIFEC